MDIEFLNPLFEAIEASGYVKIELIIHDGEGYAAADVDISALSALLHCCAVSSEVARYIDYKMGNSPAPPGIELFEEIVSRTISMDASDIFASDDLFRRLYGQIIDGRHRDVGLVASGDWLRLEIIGIESGSTKIVAWLKGKAVAVLTAVSLLAAGASYTGPDSECIGRVTAVQEQLQERVLNQAMQKGTLTDNHVLVLNEGLSQFPAAIKACDRELSAFSIFAGEGSNLTLETTGFQQRGELLAKFSAM